MKTHAILGIAALALAGCATGPYGPVYERAESQYGDGYADYRLDENRYRVQYRVENGNVELAQDWAMRRAAELTLQQRYDWFQVLSRNSAYDDDDFDRYDRFQYNQDYRDRPRYDSRYDDDAIAVIEILMGNNPPPRSASVYDARRVLDNSRDGRRY